MGLPRLFGLFRLSGLEKGYRDWGIVKRICKYLPWTLDPGPWTLCPDEPRIQRIGVPQNLRHGLVDPPVRRQDVR